MQISLINFIYLFFFGGIGSDLQFSTKSHQNIDPIEFISLRLLLHLYFKLQLTRNNKTKNIFEALIIHCHFIIIICLVSIFCCLCRSISYRLLDGLFVSLCGLDLRVFCPDCLTCCCVAGRVAPVGSGAGSAAAVSPLMRRWRFWGLFQLRLLHGCEYTPVHKITQNNMHLICLLSHHKSQSQNETEYRVTVKGSFLIISHLIDLMHPC